jgi:hypothetical protein
MQQRYCVASRSGRTGLNSFFKHRDVQMLRFYRWLKESEPKTVGQWIKRIFFAIVALFLVWWLLGVYVH